MSNISVTYGEMEQAGAQLGRGREEMAQTLQGLQTLIGGLVSSGFVTDQASGRFHEAYSEYTTAATTVVNRLSEIQSFLTRSAGAMRDMDAQIAASIN